MTSANELKELFDLFDIQGELTPNHLRQAKKKVINRDILLIILITDERVKQSPYPGGCASAPTQHD
jgi:hypothetical protein